MGRYRRCTISLIRLTALVCTTVILSSSPTPAHPHVFVDYTVRLILTGDRLTAVRLTWTFDDMFSGLILQEFDQDHNGTLSAAEIQRIEAKHLADFKRMTYYTNI